MKLKIAAKIDRVDQQYFKEQVEPLLSQPHVEFVGEISDAEKSEFLGNAVGLLFPIAWREPFGMAMIEAMACGTPVVARRNGSVPEVVDDGVTVLLSRAKRKLRRRPGDCTSSTGSRFGKYLKSDSPRSAWQKTMSPFTTA
jgi:glycosyltransferase involved in cell wall biosynthesis